MSARAGIVVTGTEELVVATVLVVLSIFGLFRLLPKELVPTEDQVWIFTVVRAPEGATLDYTDRYTRMVESIL